MAIPAHIIYHYPCPDGGYAALAFSEYSRRCGLATDFRFHGLSYAPMDEAAMDGLLVRFDIQPDHVVYLVDIIGADGLLEKICARAARVVLIDHHKTAAERIERLREAGLPPNLKVVMHMDNSAAMLALLHCDTELPWAPDSTGGVIDLYPVVELVEDYDLWRFALPDTKAFNAGLVARKIEYNHERNPVVFEELRALKADALIAEGRRILEEREATIEQLLTTRVVTTVTDGRKTFRAYMVECGDYSVVSDAGHRLAELAQKDGLDPLAVLASPSDIAKRRFKYSLRSVAQFDCSQVAKHYGGGGHAGAAGFYTTEALAVEGQSEAGAPGGSPKKKRPRVDGEGEGEGEGEE